MKIKEIKFYNAIKIGPNETCVLFSYEYPGMIACEIELLDNNLIRLRCKKTGNTSYSSLYNACWFVEDIEDESRRVQNSKADVGASEDRTTKRQVHKAK
jgi:hypothetical protein